MIPTLVRDRIIPALSGAPVLLWVVLIAVALVLTYGASFLAYDPMYALIWGDQLRQLELPGFELRFAPTPHPLANAVSAVVTVLGERAPAAMVGLVMLSFGLLGWACYSLGRALFSWPVGVLFAWLVLTREFLARQGLQSTVDVPFLALVVTAGVLEARSPRRGTPVLVLLSLAGLLRPEAWLLAGAYWVYLARGMANSERVRMAAITVSAPVLWAFFDLAATGDPFYSLHGTQDLAAALGRPRGLSNATSKLPLSMELILGQEVVTIGLVGAVLALGFHFKRSLLPAAAAALGLVTFAVLATQGLPVLTRYLILPAVALALAASVAAFGWASLPARSWLRLPWIAGSAVCVLILVPASISSIEYTRALPFEVRAKAERDLAALANDPAVKAAYSSCDRLSYAPDAAVIVPLAYASGLSPERFRSRDGDPESGTVVVARTSSVNAQYIRAGEPIPTLSPPPGFPLVKANESWALYARC